MLKPKPALWFDLLAVLSGVACVLAVFFVTVDAANGREPQGRGEPSQVQATALETYEGVVTDSKCGAKHKPALAASAAECARVCVHGGENFALVDGEKIYSLEGKRELLKRAAGERVTIYGILTGNKIAVASVHEPTQ